MKRAIPVLYEDDWIVIIEKPPGLLTEPAPGKQAHSLVEVVNQELRPSGASYRLYPCHRLDRDTSGVIMFAKTKAAQQAIMDLFRHHRIQKSYLALVHGNPARDQATVSSPIEGKSAKTAYRVLERRRQFCVVEVRPQTGRTNQIRIHFKSIGHPLVGETRYAFRKDFSLKARRVMLHAQALAFTHPWLAKPVCVESGLTRDFQSFLASHP